MRLIQSRGFTSDRDDETSLRDSMLLYVTGETSSKYNRIISFEPGAKIDNDN